MSENTSEAEALGILIESLASDDAVVRQQARDQLVASGGQQVTRALVGELVHPLRQVRWEAAKALTAIADPVAAPGLMNALEDEDEDVRWVAGEGLIALGGVGLQTVLNGLTKRAMSVDFCRGAHHVLHDLRERGYAETVAPVVKALDSSEPQVTAPPAALSALLVLWNND